MVIWSSGSWSMFEESGGWFCVWDMLARASDEFGAVEGRR